MVLGPLVALEWQAMAPKLVRDANTRMRHAKTYAYAVPGRRRWPETRLHLQPRARGQHAAQNAARRAPAICCDGEILMHPLAFPITYVDGRCGAAGRAQHATYGFKILTHHLKRDREIADPRRVRLEAARPELPGDRGQPREPAPGRAVVAERAR